MEIPRFMSKQGRPGMNLFPERCFRYGNLKQDFLAFLLKQCSFLDERCTKVRSYLVVSTIYRS